MKEVASSHIWEVGYDSEASELHIRYVPSVASPEGRLVIYHEVDAKTAEQVMSAPSVGTAVHELIRGKFQAR
jgi:hypothetical protein